METKVTVKTASNEAGNYQVPFVLPGNYTVVVELAGFKKIERRDVHVATNEKVTLDFTLDLGAVTDSVTITTAAPTLNTVNAELGQVMDHTYVGMVSVSLNHNVMNMEQLVPGVTGTTGTYTSSAQTMIAISGGGGKQGGNEVIIDGMPNTTTSGNYGFVPSVDSTDEVKVHSTMFDASLGHSNGGAISITTRGGGNDLHGAVYWMRQWRALNASSWTNNSLGVPKPATKYQQIGYTVSGPVYLPKIFNGRNRTFFSTSLERDHDPRENPETARMPTALERTGDFSKTIALTGGPLAIYDPLTTKVTGNTATRTVFPGAVIPTSRLNATGLAVLSLYDLPNQSGVQQSLMGVNNWGIDPTYTVDQRQVGVRVDHSISDRQRLFARYGTLDRLQDPQGLFLGAASFPIVGTNQIGTTNNRRTNVALDDTIIVSPSLVGSVRLGALIYGSTSSTGAAGVDPAPLKLPSILVSNQAYQGFPNFILNENLPTVGSTASFSRQTVYTAMTNWTKLKGDHSINFGADYRMGRVNSVNPGSNGAGTFNISPTFTQADPFTPNSANTSGSAMAAAATLLATAWAQDTRHVTEPKIPAACATLPARLAAPGGVLAEAYEGKLDTARIQQALDGCTPGRAVVLKADGGRNAFLTGPLELRRGVALVIDAGARLLASRDPRVYDLAPGACGIVSNKNGCKPLLHGEGVAGAAVMGDGMIDGRGGAKLLGQDITWWGLADKAGARPVVTGVTGRQQCPRILVLRRCDDFTLYRITLKSSPNYHVTYDDDDGFTAWGVKLWTPGKGAKNTDGIDPGNATNVTITHCYLNAGDDNVCLKPGPGRPTTHMSIVHNHFYQGHGMSIGSQTDGGASAIRVRDLSIDGASQGLRIKSNDTRGGPVNDVVYEDVCIRNSANPIVMESHYSNFVSQAKGRIPVFTNIVLRNVRILDGGAILLDGYDAAHRLGLTFDNVVLDAPDKIKITASHASVTEGPGPVNFRPAGEDVTILGKPGQGTPNSCKDKFVPFPEVN